MIEILFMMISFFAGWLINSLFEDRTYSITVNTQLIEDIKEAVIEIIEELKDD